MPTKGFLTRIRDAVVRWRSGLSAAAMIVLYQAGTRIGIPGVDGKVVHDWIAGGHGALIAFYSFVTGGGTAHGTLLALGIGPYIAARFYLFIARSFSDRLRVATNGEGGTRAIRAMTLGIAVAQAYGYLEFVSSISGAVTEPGPVFLFRTTMLLTGGALAASLLAEQLFKRPTDDHVEPADAAPNEDTRIERLTSTQDAAMIAACPAVSSQRTLLPSPLSMPSKSAQARSTAAVSSPRGASQRDASSASSPES
ncbi:MAG TPA: hypothetical protein VGM82_17970 [Gemmatimonadaceae bacterium]|jgi:hypothetical protein